MDRYIVFMGMKLATFNFAEVRDKFIFCSFDSYSAITDSSKVSPPNSNSR